MAFLLSLAQSDSKAKAREYCASFYNGEPVLSVSSITFGVVPVFFNRVNNGQVFDCVEIDEETFISGQENYQKLKKQYPTLTYQNKNVFDMDFSQYKHINLDFCGQLTNTLMFDLFKHLKNFNGKVFITLLRGREQFEPAYYGAKDKKHFRDVVFPQMMKTFTGLDVYLPRHDYQNYKKDSKMPSNMMIYSFIRSDKSTKKPYKLQEAQELVLRYMEDQVHIHQGQFDQTDVVKATGLDLDVVEFIFKKYNL